MGKVFKKKSSSSSSSSMKAAAEAANAASLSGASEDASSIGADTVTSEKRRKASGVTYSDSNYGSTLG